MYYSLLLCYHTYNVIIYIACNKYRRYEIKCRANSFGETSCVGIFRKCASKTNIYVKQPLKLMSLKLIIGKKNHK